MRVKEEIKKSGYFWLPSAPDNKIPGTLIITDGGNIELEVIGLFNDMMDELNGNNKLERIVGEIEKYGLITLDDCHYKNKTISLIGPISKSSINVQKVFLGVAYDDKEINLFNSFQFSVDGLDEWLGLNGIKVEYLLVNDCFSSASITYTPPKEISFNLNNGMKLLTVTHSTVPTGSSKTEAKITQKMYFKLVSEQEQTLNIFIATAYKIITFLCFAIDKTVCIEDVSVTSNAICRKISEGKHYPISILLYYKSNPYTEVKPKIDCNQMLFKFDVVKEDLERILNNWLNSYETIDSALSLYFSTKEGAHKYLENQFLSLAQGLETYHRRTSTEKLMDEVIFEELVEKLVEQCPEEHKKWLSGRLTHGNEINLRKRIKNIIEPFRDIFGNNKEISSLITRILDTRNYLTHYDKSSDSKSAKGKDLYLLCLKMEAIFQLHFLQILGFTPAEIKSVFDNSYELRQKIKGF